MCLFVNLFVFQVLPNNVNSLTSKLPIENWKKYNFSNDFKKILRDCYDKGIIIK